MDDSPMAMVPKSMTLLGGFQKIVFPDGQAAHRASLTSQGKDLLEAGHLHSVQEERKGQNVTIRGLCIPETKVRQSEYFIEFSLAANRAINDSRCSCPAGISGECKHAAALFLYVNSERSEGSTDQEQKWKRPSRKAQALYPKGESIQKLFNLPSCAQPDWKSAPDNKFVEDLAACGLVNSSLHKSLTVDKKSASNPPSLPDPPPLPSGIKELLANNVTAFGRGMSAPQDRVYRERVSCKIEAVEQIWRDTLGQATSRQWFIERQFRVSASKAHRILRARKEETRQKYFLDTCLDNSNLRYGRMTEPKAKVKYAEVTGNKVIDSGLTVKANQPWLCASPDALVKTGTGELVVLEIKCPSSCKNKPIMVPYLKEGQLSKSDKYYTQVQVQLYCCNLSKANFFVFSEEDYVLLEVQRDDAFL